MSIEQDRINNLVDGMRRSEDATDLPSRPVYEIYRRYTPYRNPLFVKSEQQPSKKS